MPDAELAELHREPKTSPPLPEADFWVGLPREEAEVEDV
jgi:hypothetical protein